MAAAVLASCSREPLTLAPAEEFGPNTIAFTLQETPGTRAGGLISSSTISLGNDQNGEPVFIQERVTRLGGITRMPATKAALATTANVDSLYGAFNALIYKEDGSAFKIDGITGGPFEFAYEAKHHKWAHTFGSNPLGADPMSFIMAMPEIPTDFALNTDGKIAFSYSTSTAAAEQKDLLIAGVQLSKSTYDAVAGFGVTFQHALTGVKFAIGNTANDTKITKVSLKGMKASGTCVFDPAADPMMTWSSQSGSATFTMDISDDVYGEEGLEDGDALNDDDLNYTFWVIPQLLSDDTEIEVTYTVNGRENTLSAVINTVFDEAQEWKAGELHTFTLFPDDIAVDAEKGDTDPVVVTNTGNVDAFLRAVIVGNWQKDGNVVAPWDGAATVNTTDWTLKNGFYYSNAKVDAGDEVSFLTEYTEGTAVDGATLVIDVAVQAVADDEVWE